MGWLGMALGERLALEGFEVSGSTTREDKLTGIQEVGVIPKLIVAGPELSVNEHAAFFNCDVLIITLPPSSTNLPGQPSGRKQQTKPDDRFKQTIQAILSSKEIRPSHVVYTSSTSVYGDLQGEATEKSPLSPVTTSSMKVVQAEEVIREYFPDRSTIIRLGGLVGGGRDPGRYFAGKTGLPNGNAPVNLVHREDCVRAIVEVIRQDGWGHVFNLVSPEHPLKKDFYPAITAKQGLTPPHFDPEDLTTGKRVRSIKLVEVLGFSFQYPNPMTFPV